MFDVSFLRQDCVSSMQCRRSTFISSIAGLCKQINTCCFSHLNISFDSSSFSYFVSTTRVLCVLVSDCVARAWIATTDSCKRLGSEFGTMKINVNCIASGHNFNIGEFFVFNFLFVVWILSRPSSLSSYCISLARCLYADITTKSSNSQAIDIRMSRRLTALVCEARSDC